MLSSIICIINPIIKRLIQLQWLTACSLRNGRRKEEKKEGSRKEGKEGGREEGGREGGRLVPSLETSGTFFKMGIFGIIIYFTKYSL